MAVIHGYPDSEISFLAKLPREVKSIDRIDEVHQEMKDQFDSIEDRGLGNKFNRWKKKRQIRKIQKNIGSPLYRGAIGELKVLDKLRELSNDFHVMCGFNIDLGRYITYNGKRNLRSAQMDFIVVSKRGVILIEVKNWSSRYIKEHSGLSPHEQVDRAGRVLWIKLKSSWFSPKNPRVNNVLLSTQASMEYDHRYRFVNVKYLNNINYFIQSREEQFSEKEVRRLVNRV